MTKMNSSGARKLALQKYQTRNSQNGQNVFFFLLQTGKLNTERTAHGDLCTKQQHFTENSALSYRFFARHL